MNELMIQILALLPATLASLVTLVIAVKALVKIEQVHIATNSMREALVLATRLEALLEGRAEGRAEQKREDRN